MISAVKSRPNHYEVLGLAPTASAAEVAAAFARELSRPRVFGERGDKLALLPMLGRRGVHRKPFCGEPPREPASGTMTVKAASQTVPFANQELFIFQRINGAWKCARYSFQRRDECRTSRRIGS